MHPFGTSKPLTSWTLILGSLLPANAGLQASEQGEILETYVGHWIADSADNLCGTQRLDKLSNPALVRFDELFEATPEVREMHRKGIARDSAQGQVLGHKAKTRVIKACERLRKAGHHCSVWRAIRHEDGRCVPDLTRSVKAAL